MALPNDYLRQNCSLARTLEIIGERWTLLIVRDAFYGVRRFGEFQAHLGIPRASLSERLATLVEADILQRTGEGRAARYELTEKGRSLWPPVHMLTSWGDEHYAPAGPRRRFVHAADEQPLAPGGVCTGCGQTVAAQDVVALPGPGITPPQDDDDAVTSALRQPHRLLEPLFV